MAFSSSSNLISLKTTPITQQLSSSSSSLFAFKPFSQQQKQHKSVKVNNNRGTCKCMFGLGMPELVVIAGVATLVFGPKKLPEVGRSIGKTFKSFQQAAKEFETELKKDPGSFEEGNAAVIEIIEQVNEDVKSKQVPLWKDL